MSLEAVRQYIALLWRRYQWLTRREDKSDVLDELCRNLKIHRKSANRLMRAKSVPRLRRQAGKLRLVYSEASREHIRALWPKMGRIGSLRMQAALPDWLPYYVHCDDAVKAELLRMSAATIERILKDDKAAFRRRLNTGTRPNKIIVTQVPLRDFGFEAKVPGHCETDTVAHCGDSMSGTFVRTVTVTDMDSGWTECDAVVTMNGATVRGALTEVESRLPFPLLGLYHDNGSEFINRDVISSFAKKEQREIELRRGRPYRKNDQARVEQKNYTHVREFFGYDRIEGKVAVNMMNTIYRQEWRLLQNFFMPQTKLMSKQRVGSRIVRRLDPPKTPYRRLLDHPEVPAEVKSRLLAERERQDPFELKRRLSKKLRNFARYLSTQWFTAFRGRYHDDSSKDPTLR